MCEYYLKHKPRLNYKRKLMYNIRKFPFIKNEEDAEYWIMMRKYFSPFKKVLSECKDIEKIMDFLKHYLEYLEKEENSEYFKKPENNENEE